MNDFSHERRGRGRGMTVGGRQSARMITDTWLTPPEMVQALGEFDLDPCAANDQPWRKAKRQMTVHEGGLAHDWSGRVWLSPPYKSMKRAEIYAADDSLGSEE